MRTSSMRAAATTQTAQPNIREVAIIRRKELEETIKELLAQPSPALLKARISAEYGPQLHSLREAGYPAADVAQHYTDKLPKCSARTKKAIRAIFEDLFAASENGTSRPVSAEAEQRKRQPTSADEAVAAGRKNDTASEAAAIESADQLTPRRDPTHAAGSEQEPNGIATLEEELMRSLAPRREPTNAERSGADQGEDK